MSESIDILVKKMRKQGHLYSRATRSNTTYRFHDVTSVIDIASVVNPRKDLELIYLLSAVPT